LFVRLERGARRRYLGDEVGMLNDYSFASDPYKAGDTRWVHRPRTDWVWRERVQHDPGSPHEHIFVGLLQLITLRKQQPAIYDSDTEFVETGNGHLLGYIRHGSGQRLFVVANFSGQPQEMDANQLRVYGAGYKFTDLLTESRITSDRPLRLDPYQCMWLEACG